MALLVSLGTPARTPAQASGTGEPPMAFNVKEVTIRIVSATFVSSLEGVNARYNDESSKYRGLVLTVEVKKSADSVLTCFSQDFTLHYRYGNQSDIVRCVGMSTFSAQQDVDRPMTFFASGQGRAATGLSTTKLSTLYLDLFFQGLEPETSDVHLLVAQPIGASFKTTGWKPEKK